jgi:MATE family multidrug resistance protein
VSSGSHQIALNIASLAFMVPLGLASSGAVRVGHAIGARDTSRAIRAGWTALATGGVVMTLIGLVLFVWPTTLIGAFTSDPRIVEIGAGLLAIAAAFQLFDGTQAVATGVLRGIGETRMPMIVNVIGHWVFGLPIGYALCFSFGWGVPGLWVGLSIGLVVTAVVLARGVVEAHLRNAECRIRNSACTTQKRGLIRHDDQRRALPFLLDQFLYRAGASARAQPDGRTTL